MALLDRIRRQKAVYWKLLRTDKYNEPVLDVPREILVRWEDRIEREQNAEGETVDYRATITVGEWMSPGDYLWLGLLVDRPLVPPETNKIKVYREIPTLRATKFYRVVRL